MIFTGPFFCRCWSKIASHGGKYLLFILLFVFITYSFEDWNCWLLTMRATFPIASKVA